jgi:hypothetical protein
MDVVVESTFNYTLLDHYNKNKNKLLCNWRYHVTCTRVLTSVHQLAGKVAEAAAEPIVASILADTRRL